MVQDIPPATEANQLPRAETEKIVFFAVSTQKLAILSLCTMGLYVLYWFYKNWQIIKSREQSDIMPFWRAFFAFFSATPALCVSEIMQQLWGLSHVWRQDGMQ